MELVIKSDWLYVFDDVLTPEECEEIINLSEDNMKKSTTVGEEVEGYRTSWNTFLAKERKEEIILKTNLITEVLTSLPIKNQEDICVVRYEKGEEYKEHFDWLVEDNSQEGKDELKRGGDRVFSVMFYLSEDFEEGGTLFLGPNIEVKPKTGRCVIWRNYLNGEPNRDSKHAGLPVKNGIKYIAVKWVRQNEFI